MGDTAPGQGPGFAAPESQEEIREATKRLPARQREALELCELEGLSYDEIAAVMEVSRNTVAQLIFRGRINLVDELRGTPLASAAVPSPECERALPLIATRDDGQLEAASPDEAWLEAHLAACKRCRLAVGTMREARSAYRELAPGAPPAYPGDAGRDRPPRLRRPAIAAGLTGLLLFAGLAAVLAGDDPPTAPAGAVSGLSLGTVERDAKPTVTGKPKRGTAKKRAQSQAFAVKTIPTLTQAPTAGGAPSEPQQTRPSGETGIQPTRQTSTRKAKPKPAPTSPTQPAFVPAPTPVAETPPEESPRGRSDNKPPGHPSSNRRP
jgi:predicted DNA-binding protein (UPF0251 family)